MAEEQETIVVQVGKKLAKAGRQLTDLTQRDKAGNSPSIGNKPVEVRKTAFIAQRVAAGELIHVTKPEGDVHKFGETQDVDLTKPPTIIPEKTEEEKKKEEEEAKKKEEEEKKRRR